MELLGDRNWWLPKWLEWLPRVNVEGEPDFVGSTEEEELTPVGAGE
jgi:RND superfamily putative drug exporter